MQKLVYAFKHGRGRFKREEEEDSPHDYTPDLSGVRGKSIILMFVVVCDLVEVQYLIKLLPGLASLITDAGCMDYIAKTTLIYCMARCTNYRRYRNAKKRLSFSFLSLIKSPC